MHEEPHQVCKNKNIPNTDTKSQKGGLSDQQQLGIARHYMHEVKLITS